MSVARIATRYAKSLIDLAQERQTLEDTVEDIKILKDSISNSRDLYLLLKSPIVKSDKKEKILDAIFGESLSEVTNLFIKIIVRKGREDLLPEIVNAFVDQYKIFKHISTVTLITAVPVSDALLNTIKEKLEKSDVTDDRVEIITQIDPDIIGGFIVKLGDKLYDASIMHNLDQLKSDFVGNDYIRTH